MITNAIHILFKQIFDAFTTTTPFLIHIFHFGREEIANPYVFVVQEIGNKKIYDFIITILLADALKESTILAAKISFWFCFYVSIFCIIVCWTFEM